MKPVPARRKRRLWARIASQGILALVAIFVARLNVKLISDQLGDDGSSKSIALETFRARSIVPDAEEEDPVGEPPGGRPVGAEVRDGQTDGADGDGTPRVPAAAPIRQQQQSLYLLGKHNKFEFKHFVVDGIARSSFLQRTNDPDELGAHWVVDSYRYDCLGKLIPAIQDSLERRRRRAAELEKKGGTSPEPSSLSWKVFVLDFHDYPFPWEMGWCAGNVSALIGKDNLHWASRLVVRGRVVKPTYQYTGKDGTEVVAWNPSWQQLHEMFHPNGTHFAKVVEGAPFRELGNVVNMTEQPIAPSVHGVVRMMHYAVRSDVAEMIQKLRPNATENLVGDGRDRPGDVAHHWRRLPEVFGPYTEQLLLHSVLRGLVSDFLYNMSLTEPLISVHTGDLGQRGASGRNSAQTEYVESLLRHKIVVTAQRDKWEDHYRLMEALAAGAMVMTDPMHLPLHLKDGESVVIYRSLTDLWEKVMHYLNHPEERLAIARRGHQIAMEHHRSWVWMERMIFGDWSTRTGLPVTLPNGTKIDGKVQKAFDNFVVSESQRSISESKVQVDKVVRGSQTATVMGIATGYGLDVFERFVGSLRKAGYSGHLILGVAETIDPTVARYLQARNVTIKKLKIVRCTYPGAPGADGKPMRGKKKELGTCVHPYPDVKMRWGRFPLMRDWLEGCSTCTGPVLISDIRDLYFQGDPFGGGEEIKGLQVFEENPLLTSTDYYLVNPPIQRCKGKGLGAKPMLCSGTTIGTREAMIQYLEIMYEEMKAWLADTKCHTTLNGDDQGIHNYLYYTGKLPFAHPIPHRTGIVNTVGVDGEAASKALAQKSQEGGRARVYEGASDRSWIGLQYNITDEDGFFTNLDGSRSKVVHQYDRFGSPVKKWLEKQSFVHDKI